MDMHAMMAGQSSLVELVEKLLVLHAPGAHILVKSRVCKLMFTFSMLSAQVLVALLIMLHSLGFFDQFPAGKARSISAFAARCFFTVALYPVPGDTGPRDLCWSFGGDPSSAFHRVANSGARHSLLAELQGQKSTQGAKSSQLQPG